MTFETQASQALRQPTVTVKLFFDSCTNFFGVLPCTASAPAGKECYNTRKTCQDVPNFIYAEQIYTFVLEKEKPNPIKQAFNCLKKVDLAPAKIEPGKGLGSRNNVSIQFNDFTDDDVLTDPYQETRPYIATDTGTFFGKLLARNPYYQGRKIEVIYGFIDENGIENTETYIYQMEKLKLDRNGLVTLTGKDPLVKTEAFKNQVPELSNVTLTKTITPLFNTYFTVSDMAGLGTISPLLGGVGFIRVNDEIFGYNYIFPLGYQAFPRGLFGTTPAGHSFGDLVQPAIVYEQETPDIVLFDLLTGYAGIDPGFIDQAAWAAEVAAWLNTITLTQVISEPAGVGDIIERILKAINCELWYNPKAGKIEFKSNSPVLPSQYIPKRLSDADFMQNTIRFKSEEKLRLSQVWIYTDPKNYLGDFDEVTNYFNVAIAADLTSEGVYLYNERQVSRVFGDWLDTNAMGLTVAQNILNRYVNTPYELTAMLDAKDYNANTGIHFLLDSDKLQGVDGLPGLTQFQITSADFDPIEQTVKITALQFSDIGNPIIYGVVNANGAPDYTLATETQKARAFVADTVTEKMSDGSPSYRVVP